MGNLAIDIGFDFSVGPEDFANLERFKIKMNFPDDDNNVKIRMFLANVLKCPAFANKAKWKVAYNKTRKRRGDWVFYERACTNCKITEHENVHEMTFISNPPPKRLATGSDISKQPPKRLATGSGKEKDPKPEELDCQPRPLGQE